MIFPVVAQASTEEGLLEIVFIRLIQALSLVWPVVLPAFFVSRAKKKLSGYAYSVVLCAIAAGVSVFLAPSLLIGGLDLKLTIGSVRIYALLLFLAGAIAFILCLWAIPRIRTFNDAHD